MQHHFEVPPGFTWDSPVPIDLSKRYDVHFWEPGPRLVVYRNVLFRGAASLATPLGRAGVGQFVKVEQEDGGVVFLARQSIIRICENSHESKGEDLHPD